MQSDVTNTAPAQGEATDNAPPMFSKRIGSTVYRVTMNFSQTSSETIEDKLLRLMRSEVRDGA